MPSPYLFQARNLVTTETFTWAQNMMHYNIYILSEVTETNKNKCSQLDHFQMYFVKHFKDFQSDFQEATECL